MEAHMKAVFHPQKVMIIVHLSHIFFLTLVWQKEKKKKE